MDGKKYLDEDGLGYLAEKVNRKVVALSEMPSSPTDGATVFYIGESTSDYAQGGLYQYDGTGNKWVLKNEPSDYAFMTEEDLVNAWENVDERDIDPIGIDFMNQSALDDAWAE